MTVAVAMAVAMAMAMAEQSRRGEGEGVETRSSAQVTPAGHASLQIRVVNTYVSYVIRTSCERNSQLLSAASNVVALEISVQDEA